MRRSEAFQILLQYIKTVLEVRIHASWALQILIWLADKFSVLKGWIERLRPKDAGNYRSWRTSAREMAATCGH